MSKTFTGSWIIVIILLLICWPAALIYILIKWEEPSSYGTGRVCGACGQNYDYSLTACPRCGRPSYYSNASQPYQHGSAFCNRCGAQIEPGAQYCSKCGNRL